MVFNWEVMMPHDVKGRLIEIGDVIIAKPYNFKPEREYVGVVVDMHSPETQNCTGQMQWQGTGKLEKDYFGAEDATLVLKADGSRPAD
jgi:hypothetical protein